MKRTGRIFPVFCIQDLRKQLVSLGILSHLAYSDEAGRRIPAEAGTVIPIDRGIVIPIQSIIAIPKHCGHPLHSMPSRGRSEATLVLG